MSLRFMPPKPLGKSNKNMKNADAASKLISAQEQGSVDEIYDFLYVDRGRVSALYAQLFPEGLLTNVRTSKGTSFSDDRNIGSDIKVLKAESKSSAAGHEGIEHMFDATWSIPIEVLAELQRRQMVSTPDSLGKSMAEGHLIGALFLADCHMRIIDYASMKDIWEPAVGLFDSARRSRSATPTDTATVLDNLLEQFGNNMGDLVKLLKALSHSIHAHLLNEHIGFMWSSLHPASLTIPVHDLTLKFGGSVPGVWKVLFVYDALPDSGEPPDVSVWSGGDTSNGVLATMHIFRGMVGRPARWSGITPLMIYRGIVAQS
jgi:hypothetical protein